MLVRRHLVGFCPFLKHVNPHTVNTFTTKAHLNNPFTPRPMSSYLHIHSLRCTHCHFLLFPSGSCRAHLLTFPTHKCTPLFFLSLCYYTLTHIYTTHHRPVPSLAPRATQNDMRRVPAALFPLLTHTLAQR